MLRDRPGHEQRVGVPRTRHELDAESFDVVVRIHQRVRLQLARVARPRVDVPDRERAAERAQDFALQARRDNVLGGRCRHLLGLDPRASDLPQNVVHGRVL